MGHQCYRTYICPSTRKLGTFKQPPNGLPMLHYLYQPKAHGNQVFPKQTHTCPPAGSPRFTLSNLDHQKQTQGRDLQTAPTFYSLFLITFASLFFFQTHPAAAPAAIPIPEGLHWVDPSPEPCVVLERSLRCHRQAQIMSPSVAKSGQSYDYLFSKTYQQWH